MHDGPEDSPICPDRQWKERTIGTEDSHRFGRGIRYQPEDRPSAALAAGLGLQLAILVLAGATLIPTIVFRSAGTSDSVLSWAVFASVALCGLTAVAQASRFGAGYIVVTGVSGAAVAVSITALSEGGTALLALLMAVSSLCQLALAARLSVLRLILTPTVAGTVIMLIPVSVMPVALDALERVPEGGSPAASGLTAIVTLLVIAGVALKGNAVMRLWAPVIGVFAGALCAGWLDLYDLGRVTEASWVGLPRGAPPALELDFGPAFWTLLPAFGLVMAIGSVQTISGAVAIQRVSWRRPRAVNYRSVQKAVTTGGLGNLFCALAGTMPNTTYATGASVAELTGVAARRVGVAVGAWLIAFAFLPKAIALILAIPGPVIAAYVAAMMAMLFMIGVKLVMHDGLDYRKSLIVGFAFWVGVAFQNGMIFPQHVSGLAGGLLDNGMTAGGLTVILMTVFVEFTNLRPSRFEADFTASSLPKLREFLSEFATRSGWDAAMAQRLDAASEETLLTLIRRDDTEEARVRRRLVVTARKEGHLARLEFLVAVGEENLQDRIALLGDQTSDTPVEGDVSLRLLRHLASSVRHQQYHDTDVVTVRVEAPRVAGASQDPR